MAKKDLSEYDLRTLPKEERPKPTTGQSGDEIDLSFGDMNADEQQVVSVLSESDGPMKILDIGTEAGFGRDKAKAHLRVRNALRRPVCGNWVQKVDRGTYKLTAAGRRRDKTGAPTARAKPKASAEKKAPRKTKTPKAAKAKKAVPTNGNGKSTSPASPYALKAAEVLGQSADDEVFKIAQIALATIDCGYSDTKIAKATHLSRGFIIPRVRKLKQFGVKFDGEPGKAALLAAIDTANGVEA